MFKIKGKNKQEVFKEIERKLKNQGFLFERTDFNRPWGGFFVIDESQAEKFINIYFPADNVVELTKGGKVSPKILVVAPKKRLSWQYHHRRSEVWRVVEGKVGVMKSDDDQQKGVTIHGRKDKIILKNEERHRLIGLDAFGVVAEIWQHTDPDNPSVEDDIVRLQDDFGR
ncbi:MAG TPA: phosphoheptose isomerase [Saprospiraceae bacterium]|nr:phosphoheptose isomerase [Saprospiraceae bacterium]